MSNKNKNTEDMASGTVRLYTKLKFIKSDMTGAPIAFVSQNTTTGDVNGVSYDADVPKKVCVVDKNLRDKIMYDALYSCTIIPMKSGKNGYVVIEAQPYEFNATIETTYIKNTFYLLDVKFGNKTLRFDPFEGRNKSVYDLECFMDLLEHQVNIKNITQVAKDARNKANMLIALMNNDRFSRKR